MILAVLGGIMGMIAALLSVAVLDLGFLVGLAIWSGVGLAMVLVAVLWMLRPQGDADGSAPFAEAAAA